MKEIFIWDLNRLPNGSKVRILWKHRDKGEFRVRVDNKGRYVVNDETGYCERVYFVQSYVDRLWLIEGEDSHVEKQKGQA